MPNTEALGEGKQMVVSCKVPEGVVQVIDRKAGSQFKARATWLREAILEKLARDRDTTATRHGVYGLEKVMG